MGKFTSKDKNTVKVGNHSYINMMSKPVIMRRVQMQDIGKAFEIRPATLLNNVVYIKTAMSKPPGNCKPKNL